MSFTSVIFGAFVAGLFTLHWTAARRSARGQNLLLLAASWAFYAMWNWRFLALVIACPLVDFAAARRIAAAHDAGRRRFWLGVSLAGNLGALLAFKYFGFFSSSLAHLLREFGFQVSTPVVSLIAPLGISFFTLQIVTHSLDVYRGKLAPSRDLLAYLTFATFFPQIVSGPIGRASELLPQYAQARTFAPDPIKDGLRQILWGYVKKLVIADGLASHVSTIFGRPSDFGGAALVLGAVYFAVQIYCDFSGYTDIALGTARLFGVQLMNNFAFPYFSRDIAEFWRRWHISLSTWFRDYVFLPLGGNFGSTGRRIARFLITFTLSGLWHGANWTYVSWGALNGLYFVPYIVSDRFKLHHGTPARKRLLPRPREGWAIARTFALITVAWIIFRSPSLVAAAHYLARIVTAPAAVGLSRGLLTPLAGIGLLTAVEWVQRSRQHGLQIQSLPVCARWGAYCALILVILLFSSTGGKGFIYAQF